MKIRTSSWRPSITVVFVENQESLLTQEEGGRGKGIKNKLNPQVTRLLGEATLHYAHGRFEQENFRRPCDGWLRILHESIHLCRNSFLPSMWITITYAYSREKGDTAQAKYCLCKTVGEDPKDVGLRFHLALFYVELGDYQKAAESYEKIQKLCPEDVEAIKAWAKLYLKCSQLEHSTGILEEYLKGHQSEADLSVLDLLLAILMQNNAHIEHVHMVYFSGKELPLKLKIKAGIFYLCLGKYGEG